MKKAVLICLLTALAVMAPPTWCRPAWPDFRIALVTGPKSHSVDEALGRERLIKEYGPAAQGGEIISESFPDDFVAEAAQSVKRISNLGDDPRLKVVLVNQGLPGTMAGFRALSEKRPDVLLLVAEGHEDPGVITQTAHLAVSTDNISRGYTIPLGAKKLGAKNLVHISFPRHMNYETLLRRRNIMIEACRELGLNFYSENVIDPMEAGDIAEARKFIAESVPVWLKKYGPETAFFTTADALAGPLIGGVLKHGGFFVEADLPSPLMGYPEALGLKFSLEELDDWPAVADKVEQALSRAGGSGRFGSCVYSYGYSSSTGLGEFGRRLVLGQARIDRKSDLLAAYEKFTPGARWKISFYSDAQTGVTNHKSALVYQDTYVFGRGYLNLTEVEIPAKYYAIK